MHEINYKMFLNISKMSEKTYKTTSTKRKISSLESKGYKVVNFKNKGIKMIFECELTNILLIKQILEDTLSVSIKYPDVMNVYFNILCNDDKEYYSYKSDLEMAELMVGSFKYEIDTLKKYIEGCRKDLIKANWMKPIIRDKYDTRASKRKFVVKNKETKEVRYITPDEFSDYYRDIYFVELEKIKKLYSSKLKANVLPKEIMSKIISEARKKLESEVGGYMYVVYKKEFKIGGFNNLDNS